MKFLVSAIVITQAVAFSVVGPQSRSSSKMFAAEYAPLEGEGKINLKVHQEGIAKFGRDKERFLMLLLEVVL